MSPRIPVVPGAPRYTLFDASPVVEGGTYPAKAVVGEIIPIAATTFREGHDCLGVELTFTDPHGRTVGPFPMSTQENTDRYQANFVATSQGKWSFSISTWGDPITTWRRRAEIKIPAGLDADLELREGASLIERVASGVSQQFRATLENALATIGNTALTERARYAAATDSAVTQILESHPLRENGVVHGPWPLLVERRRALVGSWYEFFPRSEGATLEPMKSGSFASASKSLTRIAEMGFDVVYLPPIHPIGEGEPQRTQQHTTCEPTRSRFSMGNWFGTRWP